MYNKLRNTNASYWLITIIVLLFLYLTFKGINHILADKTCQACIIYKAIGFGVIMIWSTIFLSYFIWASYYYNINFGITNKDWKKIYDAKQKRSDGQYYNEEDIEDEPMYNPYNDQTFGLPPGTVRGMIAFTLLFGAIALLIVSFGMESQIGEGNFFYDQFEFFKTAFLMMIAFYFGSRSLKYLKGDSSVPVYNTKNARKSAPTEQLEITSPTDPRKKEIVVINAEDPLGEVAPTAGQTPPITAIDPMAPLAKDD